jgi:hypothetical protein
MLGTYRRLALLTVASFAAAAAVAGAVLADSTPVGTLPTGPNSLIHTIDGELVAVALPHRSNGRIWRIARPFNAKVVKQVSEGDIGKNVVVVFKAAARGTTTVIFALTKGETARAYEVRSFTISVQ